MSAKRTLAFVGALLVMATSVAQGQARGGPAGGAATGGVAAPTGNDASSAHPTDRAGTAISGGVPRMSGITPSRAELSASAFTKLDAGQRGYVTREDVAQLDGFEAAFRAGDQNGDGRLNPSEFNAAWGVYSGSTR